MMLLADIAADFPAQTRSRGRIITGQDGQNQSGWIRKSRRTTWAPGSTEVNIACDGETRRSSAIALTSIPWSGESTFGRPFWPTEAKGYLKRRRATRSKFRDLLLSGRRRGNRGCRSCSGGACQGGAPMPPPPPPAPPRPPPASQAERNRRDPSGQNRKLWPLHAKSFTLLIFATSIRAADRQIMSREPKLAGGRKSRECPGWFAPRCRSPDPLDRQILGLLAGVIAHYRWFRAQCLRDAGQHVPGPASSGGYRVPLSPASGRRMSADRYLRHDLVLVAWDDGEPGASS